ncbi:S-layer homology domain-containing protein [Pelotomaculum terephthalicicum JT]|uniref:S-layer homology domain-containing protein n=1 Tax=Pelotomaculum TaxID=191373 RepID=UPI0009C4A99A|nr:MULTISPECIES: S-layer homology domain-containing protein [Pelotomaculum]MCG9967262.1 S-layer homology domain-containing protein [Pelotomaculum terephthalicicum JT]OPX88633.1 MAG: Endo-1,4-beta-xylanase A precursor [Pelotomaculum sp. PtaB.Bin117]OPY63591.1 MAG: Endo-1,4-beta-xylanase A precursor [Pelotomaculum sp. PtaU1.Bin065]
MLSLENKILRALFPAVIALAMLLSHGFAQPAGAAEAAGDTLLSAGGLKEAPALAADAAQNVIRKPVELTFADDASWRGAISGVSVDGAALEAGKYVIDAGKITIDKSVFRTSGDYAVAVQAGGYADAQVTQKIGLLYITGDGVPREIVFTRAELAAMEQERAVFSATNDFPADLTVAAAGVPLRALLAQAGVKPEARMITFTGSDGYKAEFMIDELLKTKRYIFPDKTEVEPLIALERAERSTDFSQVSEQDTPVLCIGQRARTEQTLLSFVKILQTITVTTDAPGQWAGPTAQIIDPATRQKAATPGGAVKRGAQIALAGDPKTKIYYTTDGSAPDLDSEIYNAHGCGPLAGQAEPIVVQTDTTVKAKAVGYGKRDSEVVAFTFTVDDTQPDQSTDEQVVEDKPAGQEAPAAEKGTAFTDIQDSWAREDIEFLAARKLIHGKSDTTYEPGSEITRAEFAALLVRALGLPEGVLPEGRFQDVAAADWYAGSVAAAADEKIIMGCAGGFFRPGARITREEMAAMLARAARAAGKEETLSGGGLEQQLARFKDRQLISPWAAEDVAMAARAGIIEGLPGGDFSPGAYADRAQSAAVLRRFLTYIDSNTM